MRVISYFSVLNDRFRVQFLSSFEMHLKCVWNATQRLEAMIFLFQTDFAELSDVYVFASHGILHIPPFFVCIVYDVSEKGVNYPFFFFFFFFLTGAGIECAIDKQHSH